MQQAALLFLPRLQGRPELYLHHHSGSQVCSVFAELRCLGLFCRPQALSASVPCAFSSPGRGEPRRHSPSPFLKMEAKFCCLFKSRREWWRRNGAELPESYGDNKKTTELPLSSSLSQDVRTQGTGHLRQFYFFHTFSQLMSWLVWTRKA